MASASSLTGNLWNSFAYENLVPVQRNKNMTKQVDDHVFNPSPKKI